MARLAAGLHQVVLILPSARVYHPSSGSLCRRTPRSDVDESTGIKRSLMRYFLFKPACRSASEKAELDSGAAWRRCVLFLTLFLSGLIVCCGLFCRDFLSCFLVRSVGPVEATFSSSLCSLRIDKAIRLRSKSTSVTRTSTCSCTFTTSLGSLT